MSAAASEPSTKFHIISPTTDMSPNITATEEQEISSFSTVAPRPENAATIKITMKLETTMLKTPNGNKNSTLRSLRSKLIALLKLERWLTRGLGSRGSSS